MFVCLHSSNICYCDQAKSGTIPPNKLRVLDWTENKERNIRALLCSLNTVVWEGCNWNTIGMHQLLTPNDVKKMYRKACLAVHPDKVSLRLFLCQPNSLLPQSWWAVRTKSWPR